MNINDNGGQAFPNNEPTLKMDENGELRGLKGGATPGMSLRDYFAAAALTNEAIGGLDMLSMIADPNGEPTKNIARAVYGLADAMLEARKS